MYNRFRFGLLWTLLAVILWPACSLYAQNETVQYGNENISRDYLTKYTITVNSDAEGDNVYLYGCLFGQWQIMDTAVVKNGKAVFSGNCPAKSKKDVHSLYPKGFYKVVAKALFVAIEQKDVIENTEKDFDSESDSIKNAKSTSKDQEEDEFEFIDLVFEQQLILNQQNSIDLNSSVFKGEFSVVNSEENKVLSSINKMFDESDNLFGSVKSAAELTSSMPQSFLGQYYRLENEILKTAQSDDPTIYFAIGSASPSEFHRILSLVDFTDARLCHTSSFLFPFIEEYLTSENRKSVDEIITEVDTILVRAARGGRYQCGMYARWLYDIFDKTGDPYYEPVMLHIYDTYDRGWIPEDQERRIKRQMDRIRKLAPGAQIPELTAYDINGKQHSTNEIQTKYTILWFWDPDCDHCQEMTPVLHDLYQEKADELNFEVFAVEVNDDYDRWTAFSEKHGLDDWINLSTSMGETSEDFIEYFDIVTTPVILLIDNEKNHVIIARQITLEEVEQAMRR